MSNLNPLKMEVDIRHNQCASTAIIYFGVDYFTSVNLTEGAFDMILNRNMCQIQGVRSSYGSE